MIEPVFCVHCGTVTDCMVSHNAGHWQWECMECGRIADEDFDYDPYEEYEYDRDLPDFN